MSKILDLETAASLLLNGEIVAFPTETVYGLGAIANNPTAINQVFEIKNRPRDNPLICHFYSVEQIKKFAKVDELSEILLTKFSPGPISLLLPLIDQTLLPATCGHPKIVCRIPNHNLTLQLLQKIQIPLVGPSANTSGFFSPTNAQMVLADLGGKISGVLDGGNCQIGLESAILEVIDRKIKILRNGIIGKIEIEKYLDKIGQKYEFDSQNTIQNANEELQSQQNSANNSGINELQGQQNLPSLVVEKKRKLKNLGNQLLENEIPTIPGQKYAHYRPKTPFFIVKTFGQIIKIVAEKINPEKSNLTKNKALIFQPKIEIENKKIENTQKIVIITTQSQIQKLKIKLNLTSIEDLENSQIEIINIGKNCKEISQNFYQTLFQMDQKNVKIGYLFLPKSDENQENSNQIALWDKINKAGKYL